MEDLKVAAVCMQAAPGRIKKNLKTIRSFVSEAAQKGADIVCFPELSVTGYVLNRPHDVYRDMDPAAVMDQLIRVANEKGVLVIVGLIELSDKSKPYITQAVIGPSGLHGLYRKTHLSPAEQDIYRPGEKIGIFSYKDTTTFGVQLCYEAHFPEISTLAALMGAEILFMPHASPRGVPEEKLKSWLRHLTARAFDNAVFLVACNQVGQSGEGLSFPGVALVLSPDGHIAAVYEGEKEGLLLAELKAETLDEMRRHRMKYFLSRRRPELYGKLAERLRDVSRK